MLKKRNCVAVNNMLQFSSVPNKHTAPNKPELNGGLYTGEPFKGPWGNFPVIADEIPLTGNTLKQGNTPPPGATQQFNPYMIRPGNNASILTPSLYKNDTLRLRTSCSQTKNTTPSIPSSFDTTQDFAPLV